MQTLAGTGNSMDVALIDMFTEWLPWLGGAATISALLRWFKGHILQTLGTGGVRLALRYLYWDVLWPSRRRDWKNEYPHRPYLTKCMVFNFIRGLFYIDSSYGLFLQRFLIRQSRLANRRWSISPCRLQLTTDYSLPAIASWFRA